MFNYFKKVTAYTKMAHAIDKLNILLSNLLSQLDSGSQNGVEKEEIIGLFFIARRDIYNPMEEFSWSPIGPIMVKSISHQNISLQMAIDEIGNKLDQISSYCDEELMIVLRSIMAKGDLYHQLNNMPGLLKY